MRKFIKNFKEWFFVKEDLHFSETPTPFINEGEVWWCSLGVNVGSEIDGKNELYTRPVLILKKLSHDTFLGIPGTGQPKKGSWFVCVPFQGRTQTFVLSEIRSLSAKRLDKLIGTLTDTGVSEVRRRFAGLLQEGRLT